jgi:uncharacterized membrane protein YbhN (UPF0104 family)
MKTAGEQLKMADAEELRFAKQQQWYVATASVTFSAAAFAFLKGSHLRDYEAFAVVFFILFVAAAAVGVLWQLQDHIRTLREPDAPWQRPTDVVWLLTAVVVGVAIAVLYCLAHSLS